MSMSLSDPWTVTVSEAKAQQRRLAASVRVTGDVDDLRFVAGVDIATGPRGMNAGRAAVVVLAWPTLEPVEQSVHRAPVRFPYVPGLLSFRELPLVLAAFERLHRRPGLVVVDGQGIAHPRRCGIASHLGVLLDIPTIGCAKSRLWGVAAAELGEEAGAQVALLDRGEQIGTLLRSKRAVRPLYVSPGHRLSVAAATRWVAAMCRGYRLPEPTRLAHNVAAGAMIAPDHHDSGEGNDPDE